MASSTAHEHGPVTSHESGGERSDPSTRTSTPSLLRPVEAAAFWAGIVLPFLYIPLFVSGPGSTAGWSAGLGLVALHAVALYLGRSHNR